MKMRIKAGYTVKTIEAAGLHLNNGAGLTFRDFIINSSRHKTQHRELLNPLVREAFEYAIDRNQIVKTAWLGYASPGSTIVPPGEGPTSPRRRKGPSGAGVKGIVLMSPPNFNILPETVSAPARGATDTSGRGALSTTCGRPS